MIHEQLEKFELRDPKPFFPAHVTRMDSRAYPVSEYIRRHTSLADIDPERLYIFSSEISNQNLDSYYTKMAESSLRNYAEDASNGVAFLDSHKHHNRIGYSIHGEMYEEGGVQRVAMDSYTVRGLKLGDMSTDDFIAGVDFGLIRDVSIGFKEGAGFRYTCSACGLDLFDWDCDHIPGLEYEATINPEAEPSQQNTETRVAFAWIENARLSEVSSVFDGATPDAMIVKASREQRAGRLKGNQLDAFEQRTRIHLPRSEKFRGYELKSELGENDMGTKDENASGAPDKMLAREVAFEARSVGLEIKDDFEPLQTVQAMRAEIERLQPFEQHATEGKVLRASLIDEAIEEGVRAFGDKFDKPARQAMLEGLNIDTIKEMRSTWKEVADAKLSGGRQTVDSTGGDDDEDDDDEVSSYISESVGGV